MATMQNPLSPHIDQQTIDLWQADGVVLLKGVFTPWIDSLSRGVAALMANPSEYGHARTVIPKDGSAPFFRTIATGNASRNFAILCFSRQRRKLLRR
jgi:2-keto-3-deoxy-6-phosphogluconate aldolase